MTIKVSIERWFFVFSALICFPAALYAQQENYSIKGIHVGRDSEIELSVTALKDLGVRWVRVFADIQSWEHPDTTTNRSAAFNQAIALHKAGFSVILELNANQGKAPASALEAERYFRWVVSLPGLKEAVDVWEILNEINYNKYWKGTPAQYITLALKPAWKVFHKKNHEKVLGCSFTSGQATDGGTEITEACIKAGYLKYCDYAGLHPYLRSLEDTRSFVDRMLKLYGDKPVLITEWNMKHGYKNSENTSLWASDLSDVFGLFQTKPTIKAACLYRLLETENERGWPGLIKAGSYEPKEYFYAMYKNWR